MNRLTDAEVARLRDALLAASYDVDTVAALLGPTAHAALARGERVPALQATSGGSPLETLVRLFLVGATEPEAAVDAALPLDIALAGGLVEPHGVGLRAALDIRPYHDWWVVSDLGADTRPGPLRPDHVLGVGGASLTLAQATVRRPIATALDVGIGSGVQALHLSRHTDRVTGVDLNPRALVLADLTARLNGQSWDLVPGNLFEPVGDRRFDLIVSNPPFVVAPREDVYAYRTARFDGDGLCRTLARESVDRLAPDGWCQFLSNWLHVRGQPWQERVASWFDGIDGVDVWVWQREVQDPAEYVGMWLRDSGEEDVPDYDRRYGAWLELLAAQNVEAIGFGLVSMHHSGTSDPVVRIEEVRQQVEQPVAPHIAAWFDRQEWLRTTPDLLDARLRAEPGVRLEQVAALGSDGWQVEIQRLRQDGGLRWTGEVDQLVASLVAGCDGSTRLRDQVDLLAVAYGCDAAALAADVLPAVRHLVERGFLLPA